MNIIFKRKSRSLPHLKKSIYSKIENYSLHQQWKTFLKNELQINSILHELSKTSFDIKSQDKFKYTARSILMMKKQVIKYLQQNLLEQGKAKLKQLHAKSNYNEVKKIGLIIIFLQCREQLQKNISSNKQQNLITQLRTKMNEHINGNQICFVKIKILTILSILLLRFHGILMTTQEKHIIFKTLDLKKKKMLQMDIREQRQGQFQCLLYLLLQLYKILYLLKKDQQTILVYYNQLHAYTQIYATRQQNQKYLDVNELNKILLNMKPALNQLDIYEDSKLRKNLAFAHIQEEIIEHENQSQKILLDKKQQQNKIRISSSIKLSSKNILPQGMNKKEKRLTIKHPASFKQQIVKEENIQSILQIQKHPINFDFLVASKEKLYKVSVKIEARNGCSLIDIGVTIKCGFFIQLKRWNGISLAVIKLSFKNISQFLQKVIAYILPSEYYFRQMHNLYFSDEFLPMNIETQNIIPSMGRIKVQIGQYLRQNNTNRSIIGPKFDIPIVNLVDLMNKFDKQLNEVKSKDKLTVKRREGFILKQNYQVKNDKQTCIKMIIKRQHEATYQYCLFNVFFQRNFKGIEIYYFLQRQEQIELNEYISSLKRIGKKMVLNNRKVTKKKIIQSMLLLQNKVQRPIPVITMFKLQEQLQINQQKLQPRTIKMKNISKAKQSIVKKNDKVYELIKTEKSKYYLFVKQVHNDCIIYKSDMAKLYLPLDWKSHSWSLTKKRFRMYEGIKILSYKQNSQYFIRTHRQDQSLQIKQQIMMVTFLRHKVIKKKRGYSILLEYKTKQKQFLYEIIVNRLQRYYYLNNSPIVGWKSIDSEDAIISKYPFQLYQGIRENMSQANWYYMNIIRPKNKKMANRAYLSL